MIDRNRRRSSRNRHTLRYDKCEDRRLLTFVDVGDLRSGIAVDDDATGEGYIMYSNEVVHNRFAGIGSGNSEHFIAVRLDGLQWQYNDNWQWVNFEPAELDTIIAKVNFTSDSVQSNNFEPDQLQGVDFHKDSQSLEHEIRVVANRYADQYNEGEFSVLTERSKIYLPDFSPDFDNQNQLDRIAEGIFNYEKANQHLPGLANFDTDGNALLSWRVHILPHIGLESLYSKFNLDEPWSSPHNLALSEEMPDIYKSEGFASNSWTLFQAVVSNENGFPSDGSPPELDDMESKTMLVAVERLNAVTWTSPVDFHYFPDAQFDGTTHTWKRSYDHFEPEAGSRIAQGLADYAETFGHYPLQSSRSTNGTPLLSWRVEILPFLGFRDLYEQFHHNEPWDSEHNLGLLGQMPDIYRTRFSSQQGKTNVLGIDGPGAIFDSSRVEGLRSDQITDGPSNTILFLKARKFSELVEWTRPVDFLLDNSVSADSLAGQYAIMVDGETRRLNFEQPFPNRILPWTTPNGSELNPSSIWNSAYDRLLPSDKLSALLDGIRDYESHHAVYPHNIYGAVDDSPLLSWRVRILPFIGQLPLYNRFRFNEPWNSEHNTQWIKWIPEVFKTRDASDGFTTFQGVHGDNTFFPDSDNPRDQSSFQGNDNVATIVQVNPDEAIEWTRPDNLHFDSATIRSRFDNPAAFGFFVGLNDWTVQFIDDTVGNDVLNRFLSPADYADSDIDLKIIRDLSGANYWSEHNANSTSSGLKELASGVKDYELAFSRIPHHAIYDAGQSLLSWRVEILPFIGYEELYNKFNHDEPWDSEHNLSLLPLMPHHFSHSTVENGMTVFQALVHPWNIGDQPETLFPVSNQFDFSSDAIADGATNTIMFVETAADQAVEWTRPDDFRYNTADPKDGLLIGQHDQGMWVAFADGSTRFVPSNFLNQQLAAAVSPMEGNIPDFESTDSYHLGTIAPPITLFGTNEDDVVLIREDGITLEVTINGITESFQNETRVKINGLEGSDTVTFESIGGSPIEYVADAILVGQYRVALSNFESVDTLGQERILVRRSNIDFEIWQDQYSREQGFGDDPLPAWDTKWHIEDSAGTGKLSLRVWNFVDFELDRLYKPAGPTPKLDITWSGIAEIEARFYADDNDPSLSLVSSDKDDVFSADIDYVRLSNSETTLFWEREGKYGSSVKLVNTFGETNDVIVNGGAYVFSAGQSVSVALGDPHEGSYITTTTGRVHISGGVSINHDVYFNSRMWDVHAVLGPNYAVFDDLPPVTWSGTFSHIEYTTKVTFVDTEADDDLFVDLNRYDDHGWFNDLWTYTYVDEVNIESTAGYDSFKFTPDTYNDEFHARFDGDVFTVETEEFRINLKNFDDIWLNNTDGEIVYGGNEGVDEFRVSDPDGHILVEHEGRPPVRYSGFDSIGIYSQEPQSTIVFDSVLDSSQITLRQNSVVVNGVNLPLQNFQTVTASGNGSGQNVILVGTNGDDEFRFNGSTAIFATSDGGQLSATNYGEFIARGGDGNDSAFLSGKSEGTNVFYASAALGQLTMNNSSVVATGFALIAATSNSDEDLATFVGSDADEDFFASPETARFVGSDFVRNATGFEKVVANSGGGSDFANVTDSTDDDLLFARPGFSRLEIANGNSVVLNEFSIVRSVSSQGADRAQLEGSDEADRFLGSNFFGRLNLANGSSLIAVSYPVVQADGRLGDDKAFLSDSEQDDFFFATATQSSLSGDGFRNIANNFEFVASMASQGNDTAEFRGTTEDERFYANPKLANLTGESFFLFGSGFDRTTAFGLGGSDSAVLRDSDGVDHFYGNGMLANLSGEGYHNEVRGFDSVEAISVSGRDTAFLLAPMFSTFYGHRAASFIRAENYQAKATGFSFVSASSLGGNHTAELHDSDEDETAGIQDELAWLEGESYRIEVSEYEKVELFSFRGGTDQLFVNDPDFDWEAFGHWN